MTVISSWCDMICVRKNIGAISKSYYQKISLLQRDFSLFQSEAHALSLLGAACFTDDSLVATFTLRNRLRKTHLRLLQWHQSTLENLAIEATNEVLVSLVLIFSCYFNSHIGYIIANLSLLCNGFIEKFLFWRFGIFYFWSKVL